ncbi:putative Hsp90 co-chaperone Cdc37 [Naematelia encephala]|uniref:Hsp90 chaperone protein kinase-targeting subunit n=1 Tax=Naematelia encephala TaxID=71784 RepID=A0A1Y2APC7_9TREE|nr:putative Hsp90 co-chaperone Cdc37 [Naematelia encephala]
MPLNYSKWDMLELSDDSDIEEHPNVDKKSMIKWKQRDIHEKREARKLKLAKLNSELDLNAVLRPRIVSIAEGVSSKGADYYRSVQRRLREDPSPDKPSTGAANQPTYDQMMGQLLSDVWRESAHLVDGATFDEAKKSVVKDGKKVDEKTGVPDWAEGSLPDGKKEVLATRLEERLRWHLKELDNRDKEVRTEIEELEKEMHKKITSEDIHDGWSKSSVVAPKPSPLEDKPKPNKEKASTKTETIEVLNPGASTSSAPLKTATPDPDDDDEVELGPLTPSGRAFAQIPLGDFARSYAAIQRDSSVLTEKTHDSLLAEAFDAERRGDHDLARRCVHQSLLINYCRQLGKDGVGLFFQKMIARNPKSIEMFTQDFQQTYNRIAQRTKEMISEEETEREQIQLVAEDPNVTIGFNLPDGPAPDDLRVEGEGAEELDLDQVRAFLDRKWEIFQSFDQPLQAALKTEKLDQVNKVLGRMKVKDAEAVVALLQEGGMLSFSESGVRDMTKN